MIDGVDVKIGDNVFVLGFGHATVTSISNNGSFTVKVGRSGTQLIRDGGYIGNSRRVFWHDPFIITPPKNLQLWQAFKNMALNDYNQLIELFRSGSIPVNGELKPVEE